MIQFVNPREEQEKRIAGKMVAAIQSEFEDDDIEIGDDSISLTYDTTNFDYRITTKNLPSQIDIAVRYAVALIKNKVRKDLQENLDDEALDPSKDPYKYEDKLLNALEAYVDRKPPGTTFGVNVLNYVGMIEEIEYGITASIRKYFPDIGLGEEDLLYSVYINDDDNIDFLENPDFDELDAYEAAFQAFERFLDIISGRTHLHEFSYVFTNKDHSGLTAFERSLKKHIKEKRGATSDDSNILEEIEERIDTSIRRMRPDFDYRGIDRVFSFGVDETQSLNLLPHEKFKDLPGAELVIKFLKRFWQEQYRDHTAQYIKQNLDSRDINGFNHLETKLYDEFRVNGLCLERLFFGENEISVSSLGKKIHEALKTAAARTRLPDDGVNTEIRFMRFNNLLPHLVISIDSNINKAITLRNSLIRSLSDSGFAGAQTGYSSSDDYYVAIVPLTPGNVGLVHQQLVVEAEAFGSRWKSDFKNMAKRVR